MPLWSAPSAETKETNPTHPPEVQSRDTISARFSRVARELAPVYSEIRHESVRCMFNTALLFIVLVLGAVLFTSVESEHELTTKCAIRRQRTRFLDELWSQTDQLDRKQWKMLALRKLGDYEEKLSQAISEGMNSYSGHRVWTFGNSLVYAWTVVTTLGYGHLSPSTDSGRAVTMVYALLGIPIFLAVLADYGKLLTRILKLCMAHVYRMYRHCTTCTRVRPAGSETGSRAPRAPEDSAVVVVDDEFNLPISLALSILAFYLLIGSALFALTEDWSYFESFYFVFISMTTIGFGDYVPSSAGVMMATVLYMIFGLALTSMCINVIQEKLANQLQQASLKLGSRLGVAAGVEGSSRPPPVVEVAAVHGKAG